MKFLVTGIGITGKSILSELLKKVFSISGFDVEYIETDYEIIPGEFSESKIYIIEDVHITGEEAVLPLNSYDLILYVQPSLISHILFWTNRMINWFKTGKYSWDKKYGWYGTGKSYDFRNIFPIFKAFLYDFRNRKKWISSDLKKISSFRCAVIRSQWIPNGIKFSWISKGIKFSVKKHLPFNFLIKD